jgi:hypothetical protein
MRRSMGMTWGLTILASFVQAVFMALLVTALGSLMPGGQHSSQAQRLVPSCGLALWRPRPWSMSCSRATASRSGQLKPATIS